VSGRFDVADHNLCESWINGKGSSCSSEQIDSIDPSTGAVFGSVNDGGREGVDDAVAAASRALDGPWRTMGAGRRRELLSAWAAQVAEVTDQLARLEGLEVGRPVTDARAINGLAPLFIEECGRLAETLSQSSDGTIYRPRGVVAAITPWNAPVLNVILRAAPSLATGNTLVLKPSELSPRSAVLLAQLATNAGVPPGVFNVVLGTGLSAGAPLAAHRDVAMVTFTGSTKTGQAIAREASVASLKPLMMECGGKSPQIVLPDMIDDPSLWAGVFTAAFWNTGQWCAAKSRLLVPKGRLSKAVEGLAEAAVSFRVGRPSDHATYLGPIASRRQLHQVEHYQARAREIAEVIALPCPRGDVDANGFYVTPEVVIRPPMNSAVVQEEVFGPLLTIHEYADLDEAVRLANATDYGLAASLWTSDHRVAERIADQIQAGLLTVLTSPSANTLLGGAGTFEPQKQSGYGVEGGLAGLRAYTAPQAISFR